MEPKSVRYYIWLTKAFLKKHSAIVAAFSVAGFIFGSFLSTFQIEPPKIGKERLIGVAGNYEVSTLPISIQKKLSRGLTTINESGEVVPDIASEYKVEDSGKKYVFKLQPDIKWQDGKQFTSADVNYNFKDVNIETPDDITIVFNLKEPYAPFPSLTSQPLFKPGLVGIGDYQIVRIKRNKKIIESLILKNLKIDKLITYKFYPSETGAVLAFKLGEVNELEGIKDFEKIKNLKQVKIFPNVAKNRFVAVFFNLQESLFQDKSLRQALAYTIKDAVKDQDRAYSSYDASSWVYNSKVKHYDYDLENAKKLLGKNKTASGSAETKFTLTTIETYKQTAEELAKDWQEAGFSVDVEGTRTKPDRFQALLAAYEIPLDPDQYSLWHSTQQTNITGYQSPKIDKLLEDGRKTVDLNQRKQIYIDLQKALLEDLPTIFLFYPKEYNIQRG